MSVIDDISTFFESVVPIIQTITKYRHWNNIKWSKRQESLKVEGFYLASNAMPSGRVWDTSQTTWQLQMITSVHYQLSWIHFLLALSDPIEIFQIHTTPPLTVINWQNPEENWALPGYRPRQHWGWAFRLCAEELPDVLTTILTCPLYRPQFHLVFK